VKRSQNVTRVLLGGLTVGALTACSPKMTPARVTPETYYANDDQVPGAGYYHAPFQAFFPRRYNDYDAQRKQYFYGGQWGAEPHHSIVNLSAPTPEAARLAEAMRTSQTGDGVIPRSGFGRSSGSRFVPS
jgi:hypothetical protein